VSLGWSPSRNRIWCILALNMTSGGNNFFRTFQDLKVQFPGLSRSWNFKEKKSRTFQEAWEPCIIHGQIRFSARLAHMSVACGSHKSGWPPIWKTWKIQGIRHWSEKLGKIGGKSGKLWFACGMLLELL